MTRRAPEKALYEAVCRLYRAHGIFVTRIAQPRATMQTPGLPDLHLMHPAFGQAWQELKAATGRLSPAQRAWHAEAAKVGAPVDVIRSIDEALAFLVRVGLRREAR